MNIREVAAQRLLVGGFSIAQRVQASMSLVVGSKVRSQLFTSYDIYLCHITLDFGYLDLHTPFNKRRSRHVLKIHVSPGGGAGRMSGNGSGRVQRHAFDRGL